MCLDELAYILVGRPEQIYGHLVIDEAQDVTPMEARSLARRCPSGSMTVLGDLAQATGPHLYEGWDQLGNLLAGRDGWRRLAELLTGFRVPREVMTFVTPLGAACAPGVGTPDSVRTTGTDVIVRRGPAPIQEAVELAVGLVMEPESAGRSVAVIVADDESWSTTAHAVLRQTFDGPGKACVEAERRITVLTASAAKGLEFDHVIVVEPAAVAGDGASGLRHLFVALTRCTQSLTIIHQAALPQLLMKPTPTPSPHQSVVLRPKPATGTGTGESPGLCSRFHPDGRPCARPAGHGDGWCREPGCGGFRTSDPLLVPGVRRLPPAPGRASWQRLDQSAAETARVRVSAGARTAFVHQHRGASREASVELHSMLRPFLTNGIHHRRPDGHWVLDLHGYRLVLSPDADTITGYYSIHSERSFAQFEAGIPSRVGKKARAHRRSALTPARPETSSPLTDNVVVRQLSSEQLHVTSSACGRFERLRPGSRELPDEEFLQALRNALASDLRTAGIIRENGRLLVTTDRLEWHLTADGRTVTNVYEPGAAPSFPAKEPEPVTPPVREAAMPAPTLESPSVAQPDARSEHSLEQLLSQRMLESRAEKAHEALRHRLLADLFESAVDAGEGKYVDAWCDRPSGTVLFEVLGADGQHYAQIREAVLHLMEAAHLRPEGQPEYLVLALREAPAEAWISDTVTGAFRVSLAWRENDTWAGPGAAHINPET